MKTIEIRIPELGNAVGTTKWVAEKLEGIKDSIEVSTTKAGEPCLTYRHWKNKDKEGNPQRYILCFISNDQEYDMHYYNVLDNVYRLYAVKDGDYHHTYLFEVLSDPAKEKVNEYLDELCREFLETYNNS